ADSGELRRRRRFHHQWRQKLHNHSKRELGIHAAFHNPDIVSSIRKAMRCARTLKRMCVLLPIAVTIACGGGGASAPSSPPAPKLSFVTPPLPSGMLTFPYSQNIKVNGGGSP